MKKAIFVVLSSAILMLTGCTTSQSGGSHEELKTRSDETDAQKRANTRLDLAIGYKERRQMEDALDQIKLALASVPDFADAYSVRGLIYMSMGQNVLAEDNFLRAISLAPNNPDFNNNYGWFLCQNHREAQGIAQFETAIKNRMYSSPQKALNNAGICSLRLKNTSAAENYFLQAFQIDSGNLVASVNLAKLNYDRRDYKRAKFYIEQITKADELQADVLWLAIKIEHRIGDKLGEASLGTKLQHQHPKSPEYAAYLREAFDE